MDQLCWIHIVRSVHQVYQEFKLIYFKKIKSFKSYLKYTGVHIIPKIADFLDPKIIFCPQLKKIPQW